MDDIKVAQNDSESDNEKSPFKKTANQFEEDADISPNNPAGFAAKNAVAEAQKKARLVERRRVVKKKSSEQPSLERRVERQA